MEVYNSMTVYGAE